MLGSPPLARVLLSRDFKKTSDDRITPACAGTTAWTENIVTPI